MECYVRTNERRKELYHIKWREPLSRLETSKKKIKIKNQMKSFEKLLSSSSSLREIDKIQRVKKFELKFEFFTIVT